MLSEHSCSGKIAAEVERLVPIYLDLPEELRDELMQPSEDIPVLRSRLAALQAVELPAG